ncbi:MAG TPA: S8 family serine peptidase, partial [Firmicutes bacterium]|nr:S8 family serine peptidase [Bacillota bacterium]
LFADMAGHWAERDVAILWARGALALNPTGQDGAGQGEAGQVAARGQPAARQVTAGQVAAKFGPGEPVMRAEFARMVVAGMGEGSRLGEGLAMPFSDVDPEQPEAVYISHAAELGLVKGYEDGTFRPHALITRAEMATVLTRMLKSDRQEVRAAAQRESAFSDAASIPWWAVGYIREAVRLGVVDGYEDNTFRPSLPTSRAEAAAFIVRSLQARATVFDFMGVFVQAQGTALLVDLRGNQVGSQPVLRELALAPGAQVFRNGRRVGITDLQPYDEVGLIADERGLVVLVDGHLVAVSGPLQAVRTTGGMASVALGGHGEPLPILPQAAIFRQGKPALPTQLQPGDRVYAVLQWSSGWVRGLLASRLDLEGQVSGREGKVILLSVADGGSPRRLEAGTVVVFRDGRQASWDDIESGDELGVARDGQGRVTYAEAWSRTRARPDGVPVPGDGVAATGATATPPEPRASGSQGTTPSEPRASAREGATPPESRAGGGKRLAGLCGDPPPATAEAMGEGGANLDLTRAGKEAMRLPEFLKSFPADRQPDGRGLVIAIIDTGIDPTHPALQVGPDGKPKLVDWVDFSGEGRVSTADQGSAQGDNIVSPLGNIHLGNVRSASNSYRWGFFREADLEPDAPHGQDVNRNGRSGDVFLVFLVDASRPGVYDTVLVDSDRDQDLGDETPLHPLRVSVAQGQKPDVAWFGDRGKGIPFVVADLDPAGTWVDLGFDGNGHGTHVAGTAAAWFPRDKGSSGGGVRPRNREDGLVGVAPGARLMALKALRSSGDGSWRTIARAMSYAAEHGAQVVGISAGGQGDGGWTGSAESELMADLAARYGVTFVLAAGNSGPGLGTASPPGDGYTTLSVGAYVSPAMWEVEYGYRVPEEGLWGFSGVGPRVDGSLAPEVVAPGSAASCVPLWQNPSGYSYLDGTSMAVPYLAGMLALLRQAAAADGYTLTPADWRQVVMGGARSLPGYTLVEQGYGLVDAVRTLDQVRRLPPTASGRLPRVQVSAYLAPGVNLSGVRPGTADLGPSEAEAGVFAREMRPGEVDIHAIDLGDKPLDLQLVSDVPWIRPGRDRLLMQPWQERRFGLGYRPPSTPGLYTGELRGQAVVPAGTTSAGTGVAGATSAGAAGATSAGGTGAFGFLSTVVVPYDLGMDHQGNPAPLARRQSGSLTPARWQRSYFRVPPGSTDLTVELEVPRGEWGYQGRVRMHLYRPDGIPQGDTDYVGVGSSEGKVTLRVPSPQAGVWEVVVESAPSLSYYGLDRSLYSLNASLQAVLVSPEELRVWLPPGPETEVRIQVEATSQRRAFTGGLRGVGLARLGAPKGEGTEEHLSATASEPAVFPLPVVEAGAVELWLEVGDVSPVDTDLDLYLYRKDPGSGQWQEVASSAYPGGEPESLSLSLPLPGEYVAYVEMADGQGEAAFSLRHGVLYDQGQVQVADGASLRAPGDRWTSVVTLRVPAPEGFYTGELVIFDEGEGGQVLGAIPVIVQRGFSRVLAQVVPGGMRAEGGLVALHVREPTSLGKVEMRAKVNGQVFQVTAGEVLVPVQPTGSASYLDVVLESQFYALWRGRVVVPVVAPSYAPARATEVPSVGVPLADRPQAILRNLWQQEVHAR